MKFAREDQPIYKIESSGKSILSPADLLALIMGNSNQIKTKKRATELLNHFGGKLNEIGKATSVELQEIDLPSGRITDKQAAAIVAALELGRRRQLETPEPKPQIRSSRDGFNAIAPFIIDLPHEEFWIVLLNRSNRVLDKVRVSSGGVSGTVVDAKIIFRMAMLGKATSIILAHNHPSGNLQPSKADIDLTKKLKAAGETLDILVLDHVIVAEAGYYSFADEGLI